MAAELIREKIDPDKVSGTTVESNLKSGNFIPIQNTKSSSDVWNHMTLVGYDLNGKTEQLDGWSACRYCKKAFRTHSLRDSSGNRKNFGLSSQCRHVSQCKDRTISASSKMLQTKVTQFANVKRCLSKPCADRLKLAEVQYVVSGMHSFRSVEDDGLLTLAKTLISIGERYGNVDVGEIWYGRKSVSEYTLQQLSEFSEKIKKIIAEPIRCGNVACTTDLWTDDVVKRTYLDLSLFWIDEAWKFRHTMLQCKVFEERKTAANIEKEILRCFEQFGLVPGNTPITTDAGMYQVIEIIMKLIGGSSSKGKPISL